MKGFLKQPGSRRVGSGLLALAGLACLCICTGQLTATTIGVLSFVGDRITISVDESRSGGHVKQVRTEYIDLTDDAIDRLLVQLIGEELKRRRHSLEVVGLRSEGSLRDRAMNWPSPGSEEEAALVRSLRLALPVDPRVERFVIVHKTYSPYWNDARLRLRGLGLFIDLNPLHEIDPGRIEAFIAPYVSLELICGFVSGDDPRWSSLDVIDHRLYKRGPRDTDKSPWLALPSADRLPAIVNLVRRNVAVALDSANGRACMGE